MSDVTLFHGGDLSGWGDEHVAVGNTRWPGHLLLKRFPLLSGARPCSVVTDLFKSSVL